MRQQVHQGEPAGAQLLGAVVRVVAHVGVQSVGVRHREGAYLKLPFGHLAAGTGGQGEAFHPGYGGLRLHNGQGNFLGSLVPGAAGGNADMRHAFLRQGLHLKAYQLVSGAVEMHPCRVAEQFHRAIGLQCHGNIFHALFQGEHVHRNAHLLAATQLAGQGGKDHKRTLHGNGLLGASECAVAGRHHHHAHAAYVLGQFHAERIGPIGRHGAGAEGEHHGVEAVVLARAAHGILVTADGSSRLQLAVPGADDLVVQVPGFYAQGFHLVHAGPRVRRLEGGEVQQAFVHKGQRIGHGTAVFLGHLDGEGFFRMQFFRHLHLRVQFGPGVLYQHTLHAVQPQRQVIHRRAVRLYQGDVYVQVGRHFRGDGKAPGCIRFREFHPFAAEYRTGIFQRNQRLGARSGGDINGGLVSYIIGRFVGGETEHGKGFRVLAARAAFVVRPVGQEFPPAHMTRVPVPHQQQVAAPIGLGNVDKYRYVLNGRGEDTAFYHIYGSSVYVGVQAVVMAAGPPPVPAHLEQYIFQYMAFYRTAFGIYHGNVGGVGLVRHQVLGLGQFDAHVGAVGGKGEGLGSKAFLAAFFLYGSNYKGL